MISILLPLYNGANFLDECFTSINKQTYKNWKLFIGINGHGLNSKLFKRISDKYVNNPKVVVKEYDVKSKPQTLNLLAKEVESDYVALIDVDDKWHPEKLQKQVPLLKKYDVVGTAGKYIGNKNTKINIEVGEITYERIFFHNCFINSSVIMKKEDVDFDDVFLDDYNMWLKLLPKKPKFYNVPDILVYHRLHEDSFFNGSNNGDVNKLKGKWLRYYGDNGYMLERFGTTVIMPLLYDKYNLNDIKVSMDSVINQSFKGYEFLIVINHDNVINMVKKIINENYNEEQKKFINIKKIHDKAYKEKLSARVKKVRLKQYLDKCMNLGRYNLIAFIQPKDIWKKEKLFHQVFWIHGYDAICVGGEFYGAPKGSGKNGYRKNMVLPSRDPNAIKFYRSAVLLKRKRFKKYPTVYAGHTFLFHRHMNLIRVFY
jgi:glycosyltransferase involved in cell wall biosynthesis